MDEIETGSLPRFTYCPAKRHTHYDAPSNGTFVASNVRIQENTPWCRRRSWFSIFAVWNACRFQPRISEYIEGVYNGFGPSHPTTLLVCLVSCTAHYPVMRFSTYTYLSWKKIGYCFSYISIWSPKKWHISSDKQRHDGDLARYRKNKKDMQKKRTNGMWRMFNMRTAYSRLPCGGGPAW